MEPSPTPTIIWQVAVPDEDARRELERLLLRRHGYRTIYLGILPAGATLGVVRSAVALTERELDVLKAMLTRDHIREIAADLGISVSTVGFHLRNMMQQFGVASRHRLLARALLSGLLPANENPGSENS